MFKICISDQIYQVIVRAEEHESARTHSNLYRLLKQQPVKVLTCADCAQLKSHPEDVLKNPSALYILDITRAEALAIQKHYGVFCLSGEAPDISPLIDINDIHRSENRRPLGRGWDSVLDSVEKLPSNALILIDRYLFSESNAAYGNGFDNVKAILNELLPRDFGTKYHVTIIYAKGDDGEAYTFQEVATRLSEISKDLGRPYEITMEVIRITEQCAPMYYDFHDRFILSNYYCVEASHQLAAFNKNVATARQTIIPWALFTESSLNGTSTPPLEAITQAAATLRTFSKSLPHLTDHSIYSYAVNGKVMEKCLSIRNRLIK